LLVLGRPDEPLRAMLAAGTADMRVVLGDSFDEFVEVAPEATVVLNWTGRRELLQQVLRSATDLRWVHIMSAGINHLVSPELMSTRAVVTNGKGTFSGSLGEWVLGAILYFAKDFRRLIRAQERGLWEPYDVVEISGQTVGIVGYGDIGKAIGRRASAMGMRVLGLTRRGSASSGGDGRLSDEPAERIFGPADRLQMIEQCDYVVVATPLTPETRGLIGREEIAAMRPDAVLINIGRGPVVDEQALIDALSSGSIKGAALDVFHQEPLPAEHVFYRMENVLLSPHCADHTATWLKDAVRLFLENLQRYRAGETLQNTVVVEQGY
jgi:phosphoglycerate dehydrogenase-like enzyme